MAEDILREEGLPATTPRYRYQDVEQCLRCLQLESKRYREGRQSSCVIFDQVDERNLQEYINNESADSLLKHSFVTYYFSSQTVILRISSNAHEIAHGTFSGIFEIWYMFQESPLAPTGRATVDEVQESRFFLAASRSLTWKRYNMAHGRPWIWMVCRMG